MTQTFIELKLSQIVPGNNYRKHYNKQAMKELTASVKEHGVLQPVIVRKKGRTYELVAGERRRRASVDAKRATIPAILRDLTDEQVAEIQAIENIQREDVNPMDEAVGFKALIEIGKHTPESLAARFGKSLSYVYTRLKLNDMPKDCQRAMAEGKIEFGHAQALARLADKKDMSLMLADVLDQDMSISDLRYHIDTDYGVRLEGAVFPWQEQCDKCASCSTTQARLFPGVDGDARCMDQKCYRSESMKMLEAMAGEYNAQGFEIVRDVDDIRKLDRSGAKIHPNTPFKKKCETCKERSFFFADADGRVVWGWHCPKKSCHDEVYYGIVREKKERVKPQEQPQPQPQEPVSREDAETRGEQESVQYTEQQMRYIDSVDGEAHQIAVEIIGDLERALIELGGPKYFEVWKKGEYDGVQVEYQ